MSGKEVFELVDKPITCFSFNKDKTKVAFSANDNHVLIYKKAGNKWVEEAKLSEHHQNVTSIAWAANSNRIVTCGADRNAYVWVDEGGKADWKPTLVILRINRAATYVRWSPKEDKFAVASGARLISVCYYEKENQWWVSKHIKKPIRSTVLSLDWHPNNILLAAGSTDFKARVFSAYIKEIEDKPGATNWGKKMPFGALMAEYSNGKGGWVHDVAFSPSGEKVAWVGHDASVSVVTAGSEASGVSTCNMNNLPLTTLVWLTEGTLVAGGHDFIPMTFCHDGSKVTFQAKVDQPAKKGDEEETMSAMAKFRSLDKKATTGAGDSKSLTVHSNAITEINAYDQAADGTASKFASSGLDGKIVIWDMRTLEKLVADLKIF